MGSQRRQSSHPPPTSDHPGIRVGAAGSNAQDVDDDEVPITPAQWKSMMGNAIHPAQIGAVLLFVLACTENDEPAEDSSRVL